MNTQEKNSTPRGRLRFAVMCSGDELPAAFAKCVHELLAIDGVELALVIVDSGPPSGSLTWKKIKKLASLKGILWGALGVLSPVKRLDCFRPVNMSKEFAGVPRIRCEVEQRGKFSQYFRSDDVETVRGFNVDFILRFAFGIIRGEILNAARYGVWSFHHGDETKFRGGPPAFWEIYKGDPVTGAILQRLTNRLDGGVVLQRCFIRTQRFSHRANLNSVMWATTYMPARVCRDILNGCAQYVEAPASRTDARVYHNPNDLEMAFFLLKTLATWLKERFLSIFFATDWNVGVVPRPIHCFLDADFKPQVEWLSYRKANHYIADPFVLKVGAQTKLLVEHFDFASNRAAIFEANLEEGVESAQAFQSAIDCGRHMSYPYTFEWGGRFYCTPEVYQTNGVSLYVLDVERNAWSRVATLVKDFAAVDPTVFQHEGRWWLFCTNHEDQVEEKLFLWHAPELMGPWEPHCANPVKVDVRSSRPAGRPFVFEGRLYRPAQDSSQSYGGAITINRVDRLTTREFAEEAVAHVDPIKGSPYRRGVHTLTGCESITVLDGNRLIFAPALTWHRMRHRMRTALEQRRAGMPRSNRQAIGRAEYPRPAAVSAEDAANKTATIAG